MAMRGFEKFIEGRAAEEVPGIVSRICGLCPWQHHLASNMAVDVCSGLKSARGRLLRELTQILAHIGDKVLHFFFMAGPDFLVDSTLAFRQKHNGHARQAPEFAEKIIRIRHHAQMMLKNSPAGHSIPKPSYPAAS